MFEVPGGSVFRFEVMNRQKDSISFKEGFGLKSMRERLEQAGGKLEVITYDSCFIVRGTLLLVNKQGEQV
ncbi:hypothetical protein D3C78_1821600 [compost metagenome]